MLIYEIGQYIHHLTGSGARFKDICKSAESEV